MLTILVNKVKKFKGQSGKMDAYDKDIIISYIIVDILTNHEE